MPYVVPLADAQAAFPQFTFVSALTPSEQKAAFHVRDAAGQDLCLKLIAPTYQLERLSREIIALQNIVHPNVVSLKQYTFSTTAQTRQHYMIEEFIAGSDLSASLQPSRAWDRPKVARFFAELSDGLSALRSQRIVHRDLKPTNIRVRQNGSPVIIDFGLARHLQLPDLTLTAQGAAIGTPMYFAPEQFRDTKREIDHRTDLFALGVLMYQALVGKHPFYRQGMTGQELFDSVCTSEAHLQDTAFAALPPQWRLLQERLLEKERSRRPAEPSQVAAMLRRLETV